MKALCTVVVLIAGWAQAAPLPALRRSAASQVKLTWDNGATMTDGRAITTNDYPALSTTVYRLPPPWTGDPLTNVAWTQSSALPFTSTTTTVSVTEGVWAFTVQHTYTGQGQTNDSDRALLIWTNTPMIPNSPNPR